jgi:hypothetical protein
MTIAYSYVLVTVQQQHDHIGAPSWHCQLPNC